MQTQILQLDIQTTFLLDIYQWLNAVLHTQCQIIYVSHWRLRHCQECSCWHGGMLNSRTFKHVGVEQCAAQLASKTIHSVTSSGQLD